MTPDDKRAAREMLTDGRLTIDQVARISAECDATGRPFLELAPAYLPGTPPAPSRPSGPPARPSRTFLWLFAGSLVFLLASSVLRLLEYRGQRLREEEQAVESSRFRSLADRQAMEASRTWHRKSFEAQDAKARERLADARESMTWAEAQVRADPDHPELYLRLVRATLGFDSYLELHSDDADVLQERARAYELRGVHDRAVQDLEKAIQIRKELAPVLADRLAQLRYFLKK